jgi:hypothetical protein
VQRVGNQGLAGLCQRSQPGTEVDG